MKRIYKLYGINCEFYVGINYIETNSRESAETANFQRLAVLRLFFIQFSAFIPFFCERFSFSIYSKRVQYNSLSYNTKMNTFLWK